MGQTLTKFAVRAGWLGAGVLVGGLLVLAWRSPVPTSSGDWAAWVQAIGTIVAIVASAGIAIFVDVNASRRRAEERRIEERQKVQDEILGTVAAAANLLSALSGAKERCEKYLWKPGGPAGDKYCVELAVQALQRLEPKLYPHVDMPSRLITLRNMAGVAVATIEGLGSMPDPTASTEAAKFLGGMHAESMKAIAEFESLAKNCGFVSERTAKTLPIVASPADVHSA